MALNYIWVGFFLIAFVVALIKLIFFGDTEIFKLLMEGMFKSAETAVMDIALPLAGVMTFFLGAECRARHGRSMFCQRPGCQPSVRCVRQPRQLQARV